MEKYLIKIKNFFVQYYSYIIIFIILVYGSYLLYNIQKNIYSIYESENTLLSDKNVIDINLYQDIIKSKEIKQSPTYSENIKNIFLPLD